MRAFLLQHGTGSEAYQLSSSSRAAKTEEVFSRKEILDDIVKWLAACDEECWLEEYNRDGSRYNAGRGAHAHLKHAEKARTLVSKIPEMTEALTLKAKAWEEERGIEFSYDGVRLLSMLDQYNSSRQVKEQEHQRQREQQRTSRSLLYRQKWNDTQSSVPGALSLESHFYMICMASLGHVSPSFDFKNSFSNLIFLSNFFFFFLNPIFK